MARCAHPKGENLRLALDRQPLSSRRRRCRTS